MSKFATKAADSPFYLARVISSSYIQSKTNRTPVSMSWRGLCHI